MSDRSNWGSKLGFILAATGSAVGLGAIWKFPYMVGANGGSAFLLPFILMVFTMGVVLILAEFIIGRARKRERCHQLQKNCRSSLGTFRFHRRLLRLLNHDLLQQRRRLVLNLSIRIRHGKSRIY